MNKNLFPNLGRNQNSKEQYFQSKFQQQQQQQQKQQRQQQQRQLQQRQRRQVRQQQQQRQTQQQYFNVPKFEDEQNNFSFDNYYKKKTTRKVPKEEFNRNGISIPFQQKQQQYQKKSSFNSPQQQSWSEEVFQFSFNENDYFNQNYQNNSFSPNKHQYQKYQQQQQQQQQPRQQQQRQQQQQQQGDISNQYHTTETQFDTDSYFKPKYPNLTKQNRFQQQQPTTQNLSRSVPNNFNNQYFQMKY